MQSYPFQPVHDFCFSRFGTQFFENPVAGLRNMRKSLRPDGTMTMIVWRGIKETMARTCEANRIAILAGARENAQTCGPGPFSMADTGVVTKQLEIAGYKDIEFEQIDAQVFVGKDPDDAMGFQLAIGPAGRSIVKPASWRKNDTTRSPRRSRLSSLNISGQKGS